MNKITDNAEISYVIIVFFLLIMLFYLTIKPSNSTSNISEVAMMKLHKCAKFVFSTYFYYDDNIINTHMQICWYFYWNITYFSWQSRLFIS